MKFKFLFFICFVLFCSCNSKLSFVNRGNEIDFYFELDMQEVITQILAMEEIYEGEIYEGEIYEGEIYEGEDGTFISEEDLISLFSESGFSNLSVKMLSKYRFSVSGKLASETDIVSRAGLISTSKNKKGIKMNISRKNMQKMYEILPQDLSTYFDLFMPPVFTDEEMSDEEYIELLDSIYPQDFAASFTSAVISVTLQNSLNKKEEVKIPLIKILNLKENIEFEI